MVSQENDHGILDLRLRCRRSISESFTTWSSRSRPPRRRLVAADTSDRTGTRRVAPTSPSVRAAVRDAGLALRMKTTISVARSVTPHTPAMPTTVAMRRGRARMTTRRRRRSSKIGVVCEPAPAPLCVWACTGTSIVCPFMISRNVGVSRRSVFPLFLLLRRFGLRRWAGIIERVMWLPEHLWYRF